MSRKAHALRCVYDVITPYPHEIMKNDACLQIRLNARLRAEFIGSCRSRERTAAQVLREFMKDYVTEAQTDQQDLFEQDFVTGDEHRP